MDNYDLTQTKVEYKPKEWCGYLRFHTGRDVFCSKEWQNQHFRISREFDDEIRQKVPNGFLPEAQIMRVGEKCFFRTNAFLYRTDGIESLGTIIERNESDVTGFIIDIDELHHLTISEDDDALKIYKENFFDKCKTEQPILVPFSHEKRKSNTNDIEFAKSLFDICKVNMKYYNDITEEEKFSKNLSEKPLYISSNNGILSPEEVIQLSCIFSNTQYDFDIGYSLTKWTSGFGPNKRNEDKWIGIFDRDPHPEQTDHISLDIKDGLCTKDNIDRVLCYLKTFHEYMEEWNELINAVEKKDFTYFTNNDRFSSMPKQKIIDGAIKAYKKILPLIEDYKKLKDAEEKLKELAKSLDQQHESIERKEENSGTRASTEQITVKEANQVVEQENPTELKAKKEFVQGVETEESMKAEELPVFAIFIKTVKVREGYFSEEKTKEGKAIFLTQQSYKDFIFDYPGSLHVIPMTRESWINLISEKAHDFGRRIAIAEKASGKKLTSKYRSIIPNNKYGKVDGAGIPGGLYEAIRRVLELEDECIAFEEEVYGQIKRR